MTPTRLRQIADQLEKACCEVRQIRHGEYRPCPACQQSANELRELAKELGKATGAVA